MAFAPPLYIDTTTATAPRSRWGLIDAADEVVPEDKRFVNGIQFHTNCRMNAAINAADCGDAFEFDLGETGDGRPTATVAPIRTYAGFTCRSVGLSQADILREAEQALVYSAPVLLERYLWTPAAAPVAGEPDQLHLMGPDTVILGGPAAVGLVAGVRLLEDYLAGEYGRRGVIHAPAGVSADLGAAQQVRWDSSDGGKPVTTRGTRWSWGAYPYTDPEGAPAAANTAWLVATGAVSLRQTAARVFGDYQQVLDRATNEVFAIATKTYVVAWECVTAAVLVNLST